MPRRKRAVAAFLVALFDISSAAAQPTQNQSHWMEFEGSKRLNIEEPRNCRGGKPWVWYAPAFFNTLPAQEDQWLVDKLRRSGVSIEGIDIGESYGSPAGADRFQKFYSYLVANGFSTKPALFARSRGALMHFAWATRHPTSVASIGGIYPVLNIESFPGEAAAAAAYGIQTEELSRALFKYNPIDTARRLVDAKVPIYILHGTADELVPLSDNARLLLLRYPKAARDNWITLEPVPGEGHNVSPKFFENESLASFLIKGAESGAACISDKDLRAFPASDIMSRLRRAVGVIAGLQRRLLIAYSLIGLLLAGLLYGGWRFSRRMRDPD